MKQALFFRAVPLLLAAEAAYILFTATLLVDLSDTFSRFDDLPQASSSQRTIFLAGASAITFVLAATALLLALGPVRSQALARRWPIRLLIASALALNLIELASSVFNIFKVQDLASNLITAGFCLAIVVFLARHTNPFRLNGKGPQSNNLPS